MSQAATAHGAAVEPAESPLTPESWGKLGMWMFLAGDAVGFGTLLAGYGAMRATSADWPNPLEVLGINLTAAMTFLLICSSVTMVKALEWLGKGDRAKAKMFLGFTALGGAIFVGLQAYEWTHPLRHVVLRHHRLPWPARDSGRLLPALGHQRGVAPATATGELQLRGDHGAVLALRRPGVDHPVHGRLPDLIRREPRGDLPCRGPTRT
jgi:hypothetical protein